MVRRMARAQILEPFFKSMPEIAFCEGVASSSCLGLRVDGRTVNVPREINTNAIFFSRILYSWPWNEFMLVYQCYQPRPIITDSDVIPRRNNITIKLAVQFPALLQWVIATL